MQVRKRLRRGDGRTKLKRLTESSVRNPGWCENHNPFIPLHACNLAIAPAERSKHLNIRSKIRMPSVVNTIGPPDMGRMNGNQSSASGTGFSPGRSWGRNTRGS